MYIIHKYLQERRTALHSATDSGHIQIVKTLIRSGADINAVDDVSVLVQYYVCVYMLYCTPMKF